VLDVRAIREDPERFRKGLARRGAADAVDEMLALDARRRELTVEVESLRADQNRASKEIGRVSGDERTALIERVSTVSARIKEIEPELERVEEELGAVLARTPNLPHESAPDGLTEEDAVEVRRHREAPSFGFEPRDHVAIGELLGVLDVERGSRTSGSRFVYLLGEIVSVQFALVRLALDVLATRGFVPVIPPVLVREEPMYGTGFLPTDESNLYVTREDELYLVGTSEVPLAAYRMDEILDEADLPLRYAGYSTCFRREAGSYGKDLAGMFRVHQFDKVEMFSFVRPEASWDEHDLLVSIEEEMVSSLEIPYRVVNVAAGDLGAPAAKKYDIEAWLPSEGRYRELTSCSNYTDYSARRLGTRLRETAGPGSPAAGGTRLVHTLNGTACAVGRTLLFLFEHYQDEGGGLAVPDVLRPYTGFDRVERRSAGS
jgi:seryl-tRNA synthetase